MVHFLFHTKLQTKKQQYFQFHHYHRHAKLLFSPILPNFLNIIKEHHKQLELNHNQNFQAIHDMQIKHKNGLFLIQYNCEVLLVAINLIDFLNIQCYQTI